MIKAIVYFISVFFFFFAIPWFFIENNPTRLFGFPTWVIWIICCSFVYALILFLWIQFFWEIKQDTDVENKQE